MAKSKFSPASLPVYFTLAVVIGMIVMLRFNGRIWWCKFGDKAIYVNEAWNSSHTSQHFFDPYSLTHILHGVAFFWIALLIFRRLDVGWRFLISIAAEAVWEVSENSSSVIDKYRQNTASIDYFGDSVANSLGDVAACAVGFWIAAKVGWRVSAAVFVTTELFLLWWIRDSLLLNILMLAYPLESIKAWQGGG